MAGRRKNGQPPSYLEHKGKGLAYVNVGGKLTYLGQYGSRESKKRYQEIIRQWQEADAKKHVPYAARFGCCIHELVAAFMDHAATYYRRADGTQTSEVPGLIVALRPVVEGYGDQDAVTFGPEALETIRQKWIEAGHCRNTINKHVGRIRRAFRWGVSKRLVPAETAAVLGMVPDLAPGRTPAHDYDPIHPVELRQLVSTLRTVNPTVAAMIRCQYLCGARPGEVCRMRMDEINTKGHVNHNGRTIRLGADVWVFQPSQHKAKHTGKCVAYLLGPKAQRLLQPFMLAAASNDGFLFSAAVERDRYHKSRKGGPWARRTPYKRKANPRQAPGDCYTQCGYAHAIHKACDKLSIDRWAPNQLRHNFLTKMDAKYGIQLASHAVGHTSTKTTEVYVERNMQAVAAVARLSA